MAGAMTLCGVGLCMIGGAMLMQSGTLAQASVSAMPVHARAASAPSNVLANAQAGPTIVWMGVTSKSDQTACVYHRLWSDGRMETRGVSLNYSVSQNCGYSYSVNDCASAFQWIEVPPPAGGNGYACRSDINGDRIVDGSDLAFVLNSWGDEGGCEPEATYPCLNLSDIAGGIALR